MRILLRDSIFRLLDLVIVLFIMVFLFLVDLIFVSLLLLAALLGHLLIICIHLLVGCKFALNLFSLVLVVVVLNSLRI